MYTFTHLTLLVLASLSAAQLGDNSRIFSQYFGAATLTVPKFDGITAEAQSSLFELCTEQGHGLQDVAALPTGARAQIEQIQVDGLCGAACTSVKIPRIDSCCGEQTSVECFRQFANAALATADATGTPTGDAGALTATAAGGAQSTSSSGSGGEAASANLYTSPIVAALLGSLAWLL